MEEYSDEVLIQKTLDGDETAFGFLIDRYKGAVHALAYRKIGDFHEAEDIAQEAFLKSYQKLLTLKNRARFAGWLYVITANCCRMFLRKQKRQKAKTIPFDKPTHKQVEELSLAHYAGEAQSRLLNESMESLPEADRLPLTLYYMSGMSCSEIGQFIGASTNAVRDRLYRARKRLKKEMVEMMEKTAKLDRLGAGFTFRIVEGLRYVKPIAPAKPVNITRFLPFGTAAAALFLCIGMLFSGASAPPFNLSGTGELVPVAFVDLPAGEEFNPTRTLALADSDLATQQSEGKSEFGKILQGIKANEGKIRSGELYIDYWWISPKQATEQIEVKFREDGMPIPSVKAGIGLKRGYYAFDGEKCRCDLAQGSFVAEEVNPEMPLPPINELLRNSERKVAYDGKKSYALYTYYQPPDLYIVEGDERVGAVKSMDPRHWLTFWGTTSISRLLEKQIDEQPEASDKILKREFVNGELCYRIQVDRWPISNYVGYILINTQRGYLPQEIYTRTTRGNSEGYIHISLEKKYGRELWYPKEVRSTMYELKGGKRKVHHIKIIRFYNFSTNVELPDEMFRLSAPEGAEVFYD